MAKLLSKLQRRGILACVLITLAMAGCSQPSSSNASATSAGHPADNATNAATSQTNVNTNTNPKGEQVYEASCRVCHDTGNLGSPRIGDKDAWQPRIAQGKDILYRHALMGFTGKSGTMPPRGNSTAPDTDVKAAVDYMVSKAQ